MRPHDRMPPTLPPELGGGRAVDLDAMMRRPPSPPPAINIQIIPHFMVLTALDVNSVFPTFGINRSDGSDVPALLLTSSDDSVMRAYLLDQAQIDHIEGFLAAHKERLKQAAEPPEHEPDTMVGTLDTQPPDSSADDDGA